MLDQQPLAPARFDLHVGVKDLGVGLVNDLDLAGIGIDPNDAIPLRAEKRSHVIRAVLPYGAENKRVFAFLIVILFLVFRPTGILGEKIFERV